MMHKEIKWDFTGKCNLRCRHCAVGKKYFFSGAQDLSRSERLAVVDNLASGGVKGISFLGGEPLFTDGDFFAVAERAANLGMKTTLVTNGLLLEAKNWGRIVDARISQVVMSLDGASAETHEYIRGKQTFARVTNNLQGFTTYRRRRNAPLRVKINTVLNRRNLSEIEPMVELCQELEADEWSVLSLGGVGFAADNIDSLGLTPQEEIEAARRVAVVINGRPPGDSFRISSQLAYPLVCDYIEKKYGLPIPKSRMCCNAAINLGFIGPDGALYPCDRISNQEYRGAKIGGAEIRPFNLLKTPFYEIWNSDYFVNMFELILNPQTYRDYQPCQHCKYLQDRSCNPCPLYSLDSKVVIHTCMIAQKALGDISGRAEMGVEAAQPPPPGKKGLPSAAVFGGRTLDPDLMRRIPVRESGVRAYTEGEHGLLFSPYTVEFLNLNKIGSTVWRMIDGQRPVGMIAAEVGEIALGVKERLAGPGSVEDLTASVAGNVQNFIAALKAAGVIRFQPGT